MSWPKRFQSDKERQQDRRVRNVMRGLTTNGKQRQRHPNFVNRMETPRVLAIQIEQRRKYHNAQALENYHRVAKAAHANGMTRHWRKSKRGRGWGKPVRKLFELQWKAFRCEADTQLQNKSVLSDGGFIES